MTVHRRQCRVYVIMLIHLILPCATLSISRPASHTGHTGGTTINVMNHTSHPKHLCMQCRTSWPLPPPSSYTHHTPSPHLSRLHSTHPARLILTWPHTSCRQCLRPPPGFQRAAACPHSPHSTRTSVTGSRTHLPNRQPHGVHDMPHFVAIPTTIMGTRAASSPHFASYQVSAMFASTARSTRSGLPT
jgi:hypothetical protein